MSRQKRVTLKKYFEKGDKPTAGQFSDLIDSFQNIEDDGFNTILYPKGDWASATEYVYGDFVYYNGSTYYCLVDHTSDEAKVPPTLPTIENTWWRVFAQKGDQGIQGIQGIQGVQGVKGDTGAATLIYSTIGIPDNSIGVNGDWAFDTSSNSYVYYKSAGVWTLVNSNKGAQGEQGEQGIQGIQGEQGIQGIQGETGPQGIQGIQGIKGDKGDTGDQGIQGETGATGLAGTNGTDGEDGDNAYVYIAYASDSSGSDFTMTFNADLDYIAVLSTNIAIPSPSASDFNGLWKNYKGATGDQGIQGIQGVQGEQGIQGVQGIKGDTGETGLTGSTGATGAAGANGVDGDNAYVYVAYASDNTGTGFSLTPNASLKYIAVLSTDIEIVSPSVGDFTGLWTKYIGEDGEGAGDMLKATYDPSNKNGDAFSMDNMVETATKKILTSAERTNLNNQSGTNSGDETTTTLGTKINGATAKTTPVDADMVGLMDSAASNILKKLSWLNIKNTLKTYFDTLYNNYVLTKAAVEAVLTGVISTHSHSVSKSDVGLGNCDNTSDADKPVSTSQQTALNLKLNNSLKGTANGLAELDEAGKVPASQLPSFVDDVIEATNYAALPGTGESGKIYITLDTNITYRWSGSAYVEISASLALGETSATAYRGDRGKTAYDHSQASGNPHGATQDNIGDGATYKQYSATEKTKLSGIATGATADTKATGAEADTGTDDAKFLTAKAAKDAHNIPSVAPGASGNVLTSNGTDWTSAAAAGGGSDTAVDPQINDYLSVNFVWAGNSSEQYNFSGGSLGTSCSYQGGYTRLHGSAANWYAQIAISPKIGTDSAGVLLDNISLAYIRGIMRVASTAASFNFGIFSGNVYVLKTDTTTPRCTFSWNAADEKMYAVCCNGTNTTATEITMPSAVSLYHNYYIVYDNGASPSAKFYVDGVLLTTITTNIPTTSASVCKNGIGSVDATSVYTSPITYSVKYK